MWKEVGEGKATMEGVAMAMASAEREIKHKEQEDINKLEKVPVAIAELGSKFQTFKLKSSREN